VTLLIVVSCLMMKCIDPHLTADLSYIDAKKIGGDAKCTARPPFAVRAMTNSVESGLAVY